MLLLVAAAVTLSAGLPIVAEVLGDVAYFSLVISVALQLLGFIKQERKSGEKTHGTH